MRGGSRLAVGILAIVILPAAWLQYRQISRLVEKPAAVPARVGKPALLLEGPGPDHVTRRLSDFRGKIVLVSFWASWCTPCRLEMPELAVMVATWNRRSNRTLDLLYMAVNVQEDAASLRPVLRDERYRELVFVLDEEGKNSERWGVEALPTTALVGPDGELQEWITGYEHWLTYRLLGRLERLDPHAVRDLPASPAPAALRASGSAPAGGAS